MFNKNHNTMENLTNKNVAQMKFNDEFMHHEFETIWKELEPKIRAILESEPDWKNKNYKELVNYVDMSGHNINDAVRDAILFEAASIIFA